MSNYTDNQGKMIYDDATGFFYEYEEPEQLDLSAHPEHLDYMWGHAPVQDMPADKTSKTCTHEIVEYVGFNEAYTYCKLCNEKM